MSETFENQAQPRAGLRVEASLIGKLNLADYQNAVPAIRDLAVVNDSDLSCESLVVTVTSDPPFFKPKHWRIDAIGPRQTYPILSLDLPLDGPLLARLSEAEPARVKFEVTSSRVDGPPLGSGEYDVELLPRNHWGGLSHLPEMIAAFVQPNDPAVDRVLKKAAQLLRDSGKNAALNGYGAGPKHAWEILSAIWGAVATETFDYSLPPASFEQTGQKVRSPSQMMDSGLGTCLDLALLFAGAAEQAGLNPLVIFTKGHAFPACWLRSEEFATTVTDDVSALRKRLLLREIVFFEATVATERPAPAFSRAADLGAQLLADDAAEFQAAIDVRRARMHKIRPLASGEAVVIEPQGPAAGAPAIELEDAPDLPEEIAPTEADPRSLTPAGRVARWQRKLLDLSLRNSLLNFRKNKKAVTFDAPDPGRLEDTLASGATLRILPRPQLMDGEDPRSRALHESRTHEDVRKRHALDALSKRDVFATVSEEDLDPTLVDLYRSARASLDEGGANTLFLALGFLVWTQDGKEQKYRAPLILIPVVLNRRSVRSGFTLSLHDDEPQLNPTLLEMLHQDFRLDIGIAEGELPKDDSGLDVKGVWSRIAEAIKDIKGWEVVPDVVLSTFSFAKHLMWKDLVHRTDSLRENPVVRHLIDTPRERYRSDAEFVDPRSLDRDCDPRETFCPLPADSSQLAAVMSAARGKDFVLIGPPGTGKSQTIANLIAHCIASGKRVLFVAEKIAALDVVHRRLREVGLGQFCLELHSSKAKKASVLAALGAAWEARGLGDAQGWEAEATRLKALRDDLNVYVKRLHQQRPNGITVHAALGKAISGEDVAVVDLPWPDPSSHDLSHMEAIRAALAKLEVHATAFGPEELLRTPLRPIGQTEWTPLWQTELIRAVRVVKASAASVGESFRHMAEVAGFDPRLRLTATERAAMAELATALPACVGTKWAFVARSNATRLIAEMRSAAAFVAEHRSLAARIGEPWSAEAVAACRRGLALLQERDTLRSTLPAPWPRSITDEIERGVSLLEQVAKDEDQLSVRYDAGRFDATALKNEWQKAEESFWPVSALKKRRLRTALARSVAGDGTPDPARDLPILSRLQKARAEVSAIDLRVVPTEVWSGTQTSIELTKSALRVQVGIGFLRSRGRWRAEGVELIASGLGGEALRQTLNSMQQMLAIDTELAQLGWLSPITQGIWTGMNTKAEVLLVALEFCGAWRSGSLQGEYQAVVRGDCGEYLQTQLRLLQERTLVEVSLARFSHLQAETGGFWQGLETDLDEAARATTFAVEIERVLPALASTVTEYSLYRTAIQRLCTSAAEPEVVREKGNRLQTSCTELAVAIGTMTRVGGFSAADQVAFETNGVDELQSRCEAIAAAAPRLQRWCSWVEAREDASVRGLRGFVEALEAGGVQPVALNRSFEVNYSRWWLDHVVSADPVLRTFVSTEHEKRIATFQELDDRYTLLTRDWIRARLCASTPGLEGVSANSEWGVLRHELTKKRRHMPLRELMERAPTVVTTLAPCLLMSPLSIAQYLAVSAATFDVVVFDEASQITVWDAIGAIARAKQVVMVGDPKQLPPTNFFNKADVEEEASEDAPEDLESILDECIGSSLPSIQLSWHYRSRHESLIAFSNRRYYGGGLVTFPSPVTDDRAVSFHYTSGLYEKGGARTNPPEAKAVVRHIVSQLKAKGFAESGHSIGVVTFNAEQQKLIEDLLDLERRNDPEIEPYFAEDRLEPIFVKNLESVQGDERDIMYFSITYGPDVAGRVSMNFGPMNRDGGERRLNVAITRARQRLRVFSSLRPEQIDLSRTQATGVTELKHFLEFAERGPRAFAEFTRGSSGGHESPFEEHVATALESRGWTVHTQVGVSAFRIDLSVVRPEAPGRYLAGIECDGATYHRSATARDRDKLRQQVLKGLGWEIFRVWSTDWWIDPRGTLDRLDSQIRMLLASDLKAPAQLPLEEPAEEDLPVGLAEKAVATGEYARSHSEAQVAIVFQPESERFFERSYDADLARMISGIIEREGPILDEVLARKVARLHGWQRTGSRITERVTRVAATAFRKTTEEIGAFFWPSHLEAEQHVPFRPGLDRSIDEVSLPELVSLATETLAIVKSEEDAVNAMAKAMGLQRVRMVSRLRLDRALAIAQGRPVD